jgi:hypothetical protein
MVLIVRLGGTYGAKFIGLLFFYKRETPMESEE